MPEGTGTRSPIHRAATNSSPTVVRRPRCKQPLEGGRREVGPSVYRFICSCATLLISASRIVRITHGRPATIGAAWSERLRRVDFSPGISDSCRPDLLDRPQRLAVTRSNTYRTPAWRAARRHRSACRRRDGQQVWRRCEIPVPDPGARLEVPDALGRSSRRCNRSVSANRLAPATLAAPVSRRSSCSSRHTAARAARRGPWTSTRWQAHGLPRVIRPWGPRRPPSRLRDGVEDPRALAGSHVRPEWIPGVVAGTVQAVRNAAADDDEIS